MYFERAHTWYTKTHRAHARTRAPTSPTRTTCLDRVTPLASLSWDIVCAILKQRNPKY